MDFSNFFNSSLLFPIAVATVLTILLSLLVFVVRLIIKRATNTVDYDSQIKELIEDEDETVKTKTKTTTFDKWNRYWGNLFKGAGLARYNDKTAHAGRDVFVAMVIAAVILSLVIQNIILGILVSIAVPFVIAFIMKSRINKKSSALNQQLPGFIFALKAQLQASETTERAMLKVVDSMPSPLFEDLKVVKNKLLASSSFKDALQELSRKTSSNDLKFMAACMIQATSSGANLENQLDSIQNVLKARREVEDEINQAVQSATPAMWIASLAIPGVFLASIILDSSAREFWLTQPIAWGILAVVAVLYGVSMYMVRGQVEKIKNI